MSSERTEHVTVWGPDSKYECEQAGELVEVRVLPDLLRPAAPTRFPENALSTALTASAAILDTILGLFLKPMCVPFGVATLLIACADLSVDIPSGWYVECGDDATSDADTGGGTRRDCLISGRAY